MSRKVQNNDNHIGVGNNQNIPKSSKVNTYPNCDNSKEEKLANVFSDILEESERLSSDSEKEKLRKESEIVNKVDDQEKQIKKSEKSMTTSVLMNTFKIAKEDTINMHCDTTRENNTVNVSSDKAEEESGRLFNDPEKILEIYTNEGTKKFREVNIDMNQDITTEKTIANVSFVEAVKETDESLNNFEKTFKESKIVNKVDDQEKQFQEIREIDDYIKHLITNDEVAGFLATEKVKNIEKKLTKIQDATDEDYYNMRDYLIFRILQRNAQRPGAVVGMTVERVKKAHHSEDGVVVMESDSSSDPDFIASTPQSTRSKTIQKLNVCLFSKRKKIPQKTVTTDDDDAPTQPGSSRKKKREENPIQKKKKPVRGLAVAKKSHPKKHPDRKILRKASGVQSKQETSSESEWNPFYDTEDEMSDCDQLAPTQDASSNKKGKDNHSHSTQKKKKILQETDTTDDDDASTKPATLTTAPPKLMIAMYGQSKANTLYVSIISGQFQLYTCSTGHVESYQVPCFTFWVKVGEITS
ncbi:unnamed protein product [Mytilus coruscus]|uniref:Uncharacterized protein n=1 Tax=Mytilus coruscus TaxID=42192 RepID=A0A6J8CDN0_MYTCO|nr:unnamed protein product [Mytilus coruscus]